MEELSDSVISLHLLNTNVFISKNNRLASWLTTSLSMPEVWGSIAGPVKSDSVANSTSATFVLSCEDGPPTIRYTLRCNIPQVR